LRGEVRQRLQRLGARLRERELAARLGKLLLEDGAPPRRGRRLPLQRIDLGLGFLHRICGVCGALGERRFRILREGMRAA